MNKIKKILLIIALVIVAVLAVQVINADKYKMVVNVVEGENIMGVNPTTEKLDFGDLSRNNGMERYVTLKSQGTVSTYIMVWKFGSISDLVKLDKNYFTLEPGQEKKLSFAIHIPPSAETKQYSGWAVIFRLPKL
ncbi:hypothetical protein KAT95_01290 [Candidatus Parcubacteria bacterium]|nr:hypothetical protein [Candidatus Parcubacteria bacterium]